MGPKLNPITKIGGSLLIVTCDGRALLVAPNRIRAGSAAALLYCWYWMRESVSFRTLLRSSVGHLDMIPRNSKTLFLLLLLLLLLSAVRRSSLKRKNESAAGARRSVGRSPSRACLSAARAPSGDCTDPRRGIQRRISHFIVKSILCSALLPIE